MTYEQRLIAEAKIAYERGEKLTFSVIKRQDTRFWKIERTRVVSSGEEEYFEGD